MSKNAIAIGIYDNMDAEDIVQDVLADIWVNKQVLLDNKITHKESLNAFLIEKIEWNEFSEILNTIIKELPTPLRFTSYLLLKKQYGELASTT
ncbi:hypothetical protein KCV26_02535 [Petrimonas sulfuriphila]|jgi:hypothetical protein|uniref:hypothetical protein n=1 Tax=Petrimonas TaxID=307628 RepID=UPI000E90073B|nr:hypothetical protein [Petrimonas sp.]MDX9775380.1 hypothetical protein [Petrimonas sp.]HBC37552.1 hypothetical protein [Porphyromonadaceae bacterium]